jgi:hypothetical protein
MKLLAFRFLTGLAMLTCSALATAQTSWTTVVNNGTTMPGTSVLFNSYNQPSVNALGTVVFRARSQGGTGTEPVHGIYTRDMLRGTAVLRVFDKTSTVPSPNNNNATFIEFPSFPRIDLLSSNVITRGTSQPVLTYTLPDGTETKAGTSGVYVKFNSSFITAASQLGIDPDFSYYQVPYAVSGTKFDQFPGAPAITGTLAVFKGNYTEDNVSKTGIYFRNITARQGLAPTSRIADTSTLIPGQGSSGSITFGATAPPSAALGMVVFTGWDNEENPTVGGIYLAPVRSNPKLTAIISIGDQVPGEASGTTFRNFGESLAFDGRYIAFWGTWGTDTHSIHLTCPTDGNKDLIAYCKQQYPDGYNPDIPVHQGIFAYDILFHRLTAIAKSPTNYEDFLYWVFSGKPPGTGGTESQDGEPARWRSSPFVAISARLITFRVAFKAHTQNYSVDGIYAAQGPNSSTFATLLDTTTLGTAVDPKAPAGSKVVALGIEREGYRYGWLAITASMLDPATTESWAGIYVRYLP